MPVQRDELQLEFARLIEAIQHYSPDFDIPRFKVAFEFASKAHEGQVRKENNKPYIIHPLETAKILTSMHVDEDTLIAALLHDVPEDTAHTIDEIDSMFGKRVSFLVDGITKLSKVHYQNDMEQRQVESLKKLLLHSAKDPRVVLIKLADRLHNMRTLKFIDKPEKIKRIAGETLEIFVPIANLFGLQSLKCELEDLCFQYLYPDDYTVAKKCVNDSIKKTDEAFHKTVLMLEKVFQKNNLKVSIVARKRNVYSIFKKLKQKNKTFDAIYDLVAIRLITDSVQDCYKALGLVHMLFRPKPGKFKDYIAVPKVNGYQSLHTTVFGIRGTITEVQIRTHAMHLEDEYGIASHYFSPNTAEQKLTSDQRFEWIKKMLNSEAEDDDNTSFMENLKGDIFQDRIFVFTPRGDIVNLPQGATAIDFAYAIHTEVGNHAISANVNGEKRPVTSTLKTGETIDIILSEDKKAGPDRHWLNFAKTNLARDRIRNFFKEKSRKNKIQLGKSLLSKELTFIGVLLEDISDRKLLKTVHDRFNSKFHTKNDIFIALAEDTLEVGKVLKALFPKSVDADGVLWGGINRLFSKFRKPQIGIKIECDHRVGIFRDILNVLAGFSLNVTKTSSSYPIFSRFVIIKVFFEAPDFDTFVQACSHVEQVPGVHHVNRFFWGRNIVFTIALFTVVSIFLVHPFLIRSLLENFEGNVVDDTDILADFLLYGGFFLLFFLILYLKNLTEKNFLKTEENATLWITTFVATTVALFTILAEIFIFHIQLNWLIVSAGIALMYLYLLSKYIQHFIYGKK